MRKHKLFSCMFSIILIFCSNFCHSGATTILGIGNELAEFKAKISSDIASLDTWIDPDNSLISEKEREVFQRLQKNLVALEEIGSSKKEGQSLTETYEQWKKSWRNHQLKEEKSRSSSQSVDCGPDVYMPEKGAPTYYFYLAFLNKMAPKVEGVFDQARLNIKVKGIEENITSIITAAAGMPPYGGFIAGGITILREANEIWKDYCKKPFNIFGGEHWEKQKKSFSNLTARIIAWRYEPYLASLDKDGMETFCTTIEERLRTFIDGNKTIMPLLITNLSGKFASGVQSLPAVRLLCEGEVYALLSSALRESRCYWSIPRCIGGGAPMLKTRDGLDWDVDGILCHTGIWTEEGRYYEGEPFPYHNIQKYWYCRGKKEEGILISEKYLRDQNTAPALSNMPQGILNIYS